MQQGGQGALLRVACYMLRAVWVSYNASGGVSEWLMVPLSKSGVRASVPWVRIPPPPPSKGIAPIRPKARLPWPPTAGARRGAGGGGGGCHVTSRDPAQRCEPRRAHGLAGARHGPVLWADLRLEGGRHPGGE